MGRTRIFANHAEIGARFSALMPYPQRSGCWIDDLATVVMQSVPASDDGTTVDFVAHRAAFDASLPKRDDTHDRLWFYAQLVARSVLLAEQTTKSDGFSARIDLRRFVSWRRCQIMTQSTTNGDAHSPKF